MKLPAWLGGRRHLEDDLQEEIRSHLAMAVREQVEGGVDPEAARRTALRKISATSRWRAKPRATPGVTGGASTPPTSRVRLPTASACWPVRLASRSLSWPFWRWASPPTPSCS